MTRDELTIWIESRLSWMKGYLQGADVDSESAQACLDAISEIVHTRICDEDLIEECKKKRAFSRMCK